MKPQVMEKIWEEEHAKLSDHLYTQLRLTISDFDRIPPQIIREEMNKALNKITIPPNLPWREKVWYKGKIIPFFMLVFEVKKNILSRS